MRKLLIILFWFICLSLGATNYYVKTGGNDASAGTSDGTAWATITKVNSFWAAGSFVPGDNIYFNRGNTFSGTITITEAGTLANRITISAYGTGANPIITGLTTLSSWTQVGSTNVYYATLDVSRLNIVTFNGVVKGMGRFPVTGYLNYETHSGNTSITDNELTGSPSWIGAEIAIRDNRWIIDRHVVTNHVTTTLTYNSLADWGGNNIYSPTNLNGYFFQNSINCLNGLSDWYYDASAKRIYMYFTGSPASYTVKAGSLNYNVNQNSTSYITISNLDFEGANLYGIYIPYNGSYVTITNCNFYSQGGDPIHSEAALTSSIDHLSITGGTITNCLNDGIFAVGDNTTIDGVTITNAGYIAGAGKSGDDTYIGIFTNGLNATVRNCIIINTGWAGISFLGDNALVEHNFINTFCSVKDDAGGIYTMFSAAPTIQNNIIINGIGAFAGVESEIWEETYGQAGHGAHGIYLDAGEDHAAIITGNTVSHCPASGIFIHENGGNSITNNTIYDCHYQMFFNEYGAGLIRNNVVTGNKFIAKLATQKAMFFQMWNSENPSLFGTFNNNYYARVTDGWGAYTSYTLSGWQTYSGQDAGSHKAPTTIADTANIHIVYNSTNTTKYYVVSASMVDVVGSSYSGNISLSPHSSLVLIGAGTILPPPTSGLKLTRNSGGKLMRSSSIKLLRVMQ
jgi:parallel beta-helix repeat protein